MLPRGVPLPLKSALRAFYLLYMSQRPVLDRIVNSGRGTFADNPVRPWSGRWTVECLLGRGV